MNKETKQPNRCHFRTNIRRTNCIVHYFWHRFVHYDRKIMSFMYVYVLFRNITMQVIPGQTCLVIKLDELHLQYVYLLLRMLGVK